MESSKNSKREFCKLQTIKGIISTRSLDEYFAALETLEFEEMSGKWNGKYFQTGSNWEWLVRDYILFKWYGKNFDDLNRVEAFICSFLGTQFNLPFCTAKLHKLKFRDKVSASITYDYFPIVDHFRKIDDNLIMGIMEVKGKIETYFYLERFI